MNILITGSSGLIGSSLVPLLLAEGHRVVRLVRSPVQAGQAAFYWDPDAGEIDQAALQGLDAVIHLAGENIARGRWTRTRKARIRDSRVRGTRLLSEALARLEEPPRVLVSASAVGYYGDRGEELLDEGSTPGAGFLAETCQAWEAATEAAERRGIRVVHLRFGVVLSAVGGALPRMLVPFRWGLGGVIGSGKQHMSWIALDDAARALLHPVKTDALRGPVNGVAPAPVTNLAFTKTVGKVLRRPTFLPMPAFALRWTLGQMADELLLSSKRVVPQRLLSTGFQFQFPQLEGALRHLLDR